ncbi:MAG TPA: signal peptidase II [Candidatus Limnocylindria bacterium]|nr:signal peptidase II [Candidatus Limnocylindria bacterium]
MSHSAPRGRGWEEPAVLLAVAAAILLADQLSKAVVIASLALGERAPVLGNLVVVWHVRNTGAAFSLFQGGLALFLVVSVAALFLIAYYHRAFRGRTLWLQGLLGVILGGTLGNLVDRVRFGYVTDFISVGIGELRWPTFNVADSSIVVGIIILVGYLSLGERPPREVAA